MEHWVAVPDYEGLYEVSDFGRVRSLMLGQKCRAALHMMRPSPVGKGYRAVDLTRDGETKRFLLHRLVLVVFIGPAPSGCESAHGNGQRDDNRLSNLAWKTPVDNAADKVAHGTFQFGSRHHAAKLTEGAVAEIRASGDRSRALAARFGVSESLICQVRKGQGWTHV